MGRKSIGWRRPAIAALIAPSLVAGWAALADAPAAVDDSRLVAADKDQSNWLTYGRTYSEQRFSPLNQIDESTVAKLGLAWYADLPAGRGLEGTPLAVDGTIYATEGWSIVHAYDAKTGKPLWTYDPQVPKEKLVQACCDAVNRGVAVWQGKVYVGTLDGRLVAIDASTGKPVWSVAITDPSQAYTVTMAPRIVHGRVLIGVSGGEFGVRCYLSSYDADTGKLAWRFYTVPGDPSKPFEQPILAKAAETWKGQWWVEGGGGPVWDSLSYDPELGLVYFGVGNGSMYPQSRRSPGGGDNLFLSSIVAVKADTGEYAWHYQTTPGEEWDYDATQQLMLADLPIDGRPRKVLMQANKNGFYYVLDRATGELISATPFAAVNWAQGVDLKTGRPIENPEIRYDRTGKPVQLQPGAGGAHSWQAMSFSPLTGLVYMPTQDTVFSYDIDPYFKPQPQGYNDAVDFAAKGQPPGGRASVDGGYLLAWDPVKRAAAWRVTQERGANGGALATAGGLVFEGTVAGNLKAYRAADGRQVWSFPARNSVIAPPIAYAVDGEEYIAVLAGWGGANGVLAGPPPPPLVGHEDLGRLLVFRLGAAAALPPLPPAAERALNPPPSTADAQTIATGSRLYVRNCLPCHGFGAVSGGVNPDLRYTPFLSDDGWFDVVLKGALKDQGMVSFAPVLDHDAAAAIRAYVIQRANETKAAASHQ